MNKSENVPIATLSGISSLSDGKNFYFVRTNLNLLDILLFLSPFNVQERETVWKRNLEYEPDFVQS